MSGWTTAWSIFPVRNTLVALSGNLPALFPVRFPMLRAIPFSLRRLLIAALLVLGGAGSCTLLDTWQRQAIFSVESESRRWWQEPSADTEVFDLTLASGETVNAWYRPSTNPDAPTVLYLHGARWNLNGSAFRFEAWADMGYSMLAIDYRGFGASSRVLPSEVSATEDATLALRELARRQPDPSRRFVYGHSLGGAIAIALAAQEDMPPFAGLIVESSFTNVAAMAGTLRWGWVPGIHLLVTQPFDSLSRLARVEVPTLFLHGTGDRVVPHTMSDELHAAAVLVPPEQRRVVKIEGGSHSGSGRGGPLYRTAVEDFISMASQARGSQENPG